MALPTVYWLSEVAKVLARISPGIAAILAFLAWAYNIVELVAVTAIVWVTERISSIDMSAFSNGGLSSVEWLSHVNGILPLSEALGVLGALTAAWVTIITVRWVKSFIPTVAN